MMPRVKYMRVSADWYVELCKGAETRKSRPIAHALPDDARLVDAKITHGGDVILVLMSDSFPELEKGQNMGELPATVFEVVHQREDGLPPRAGAMVDEMRRLADEIGSRSASPDVGAQELHMLAERLAAMAPKSVH